MISTTSTDYELIKAIRDRRNKSAFETIVHRYEEKVLRLCFRILSARAEAEDIAQDIFTKLWEHPDDWQPKATFSTWLYRVTTNRCLNRLRFLKVKSILSLSSDVKMERHSDSSVNSPESEVLSMEKSKLFHRVFRKLPGRQKAALHLRYWEDLSVKDVADALGITVKSAESLIYRGKRTLGSGLG